MTAVIFPAKRCHLHVAMVIDLWHDLENSSSMTPYATICQLMSRDGSVTKQSRLYELISKTPICLWPLIAISKRPIYM